MTCEARRTAGVPGASLGIGLALLMALAGCRGMPSSRPPIHLNPNMDNQPRYDPQEENDFFPDHRAMRMPPPGTLPAGALPADAHFATGKVGAEFSADLPAGLRLDEALLRRGQERHSIYCAPCHDVAGTGHGTVVARGMLPPPTFHDDRLRAMPVGQLFDVIGNGVRNMPAYGPQVPPADRWAIAAYVRTLQRSRMATLTQVPPDVAAKQGWTP